jgi:hypothetical protein
MVAPNFQQGSSSFLKKSTKKLLFPAPRPTVVAKEATMLRAQSKVFWCFFSKKNGFLAVPTCRFLRSLA